MTHKRKRNKKDKEKESRVEWLHHDLSQVCLCFLSFVLPSIHHHTHSSFPFLSLLFCLSFSPFFLFLSPFTIPFSFFFSFLFSFFTFSSFQTPFCFSSQVRELKWKGMVYGKKERKRAMIVLWLIVFVVCCGECLGLCLLLLHSRSLSPCVCRVIHAHVSPSPSHVLWCLSVCCVRHVTCTVCGGWHSPTHCPAVLHPLCSSLSVPLSSNTIITLKHMGVKRREGERSGWGKRERKRKKRGVMQKRVEKGGKKRKRDYDTWCSQVVSNPSTNQARRGLTSLIRREVVLSSWYGRNSLFLFLSLFVSVCG